EKFDVNNIAREVRNIIVGVASKGIKVTAELPDTPQIVIGNAGKIHQCIMNLCMNAKDAITKLDGAITIRVKKAHNKEGYLWIQVQDSGTGIPPDIIEKIFDPFFSTKKKKEGTGLGLSVVYGIVRAHKGDIFVDSRPGEGATFTIELPFATEQEKTNDKKNILVLDDDPLLRNYCIEILRGSGYDAIDFASVKEAQEWLLKYGNSAWFAVSDVVMPDMNLNEFISAFRAVRDDFKCIWMSGNLNPADQEIIKSYPFLQKPFSPTALLETIKTIKE
ncbi:MAG: ATP-binding protein, partial [Chitinivibrionales bacterium]|nr:ATP-binding protein [Chitinivibrionales bacterium]